MGNTYRFIESYFVRTTPPFLTNLCSNNSEDKTTRYAIDIVIDICYSVNSDYEIVQDT